MIKMRNLFAGMALMAAVAAAAAPDGAPRYVFYFIGDGMGLGQVSATQTYVRMVQNNARPLVMTSFPVTSLAYTYSASSPVTDSAAAGTALACGSKTKNGMLGMDADTVSVTSMARVLKDNGYGIGLVTSVSPDDATPGAFYAHVPYRGMSYEIEKQAAESGYEFIAGAGLRGLKDGDGNPTDILDVFRQNNVEVVYGLDGLKDVDSEKILLLSNNADSPNNIGYAIDSIKGAQTLAGHANDGGALIKEVIAFDQALEIAYNFYLDHKDETLIVVTADHETGGASVGCGFTGYNAYLHYIDYQKVSKEEFSAYCKGLLKSRRTYRWEDMKEYLADNLGFWVHVPVSGQQEESLKSLFDATFEMRNSADQKTLYSNFNAFAVEVFKVFNNVIGMGFTSGSHTGNPVPVFAVGVGSERFGKGCDNTEIPETILSIAGYSLK